MSKLKDFPGDAADKNPPAKARDKGLIPGPGRSHMPWRHQVRVPYLLSLIPGASVRQLLRATCLQPGLCNNRGHGNEKPAQGDKEQPLLTSTIDSLGTATKTPYNQIK